MSCFTKALLKSEEFNKILTALNLGNLPMGVLGLGQVHKAHFISAVCEKEEQKALILCPDEGKAARLAEDLNAFSSGAYLYPARDYGFITTESQSREFEQKRLGVLTKITDGDFNFIVCSVQAAMQFTMPESELKKRTLKLVNGEDYPMDSVIAALVRAGYSRCEFVEGAGQFTVRGGIIDFFPAYLSSPVRMEFWGDTLDSLTLFDIESQRRTDILEEVRIIPTTEIIFSGRDALRSAVVDFHSKVRGKGSVNVKKKLEEDLALLDSGINLSSVDKYYSLAYDKKETLFDYLDSALLFVSESYACKNTANDYIKRLNEEIKLFFEDGTLTKGLDEYNMDFESLKAVYSAMGAIYTDNLSRGSFDTPVKDLVSVRATQNSSWDGTLSSLTEELDHLKKKKEYAVIFAGTDKNAKELAYDLESADYKAMYFAVPPAEFPKSYITVLPGSISSGASYTDIGLNFFTYSKSFSSEAKRKVKKSLKKGKGIHSVEELNVGDYVVHDNYGIGIFDGIHKHVFQGVTQDYIRILYAKGSALMVPVTRLNVISKYIAPGGENAKVKINSLSGNDWERTRSKVKSAVKDMARQLIKLYRTRLNSPGFGFSPDIEMQRDFERRFEFEETEDQLTAVREIKRDMENPHPMDRLLCGDVGFGKTEVALRAAFKCVADGKQCAILVPTTILAFQHYQTLLKRFDGFPVEVQMLSRFRTPKERTQVKADLKRGFIDIVVGTHSIIAKSVEFKDLGLLVIDEEQRFGVAQKEKLKEKFPTVDVLTLSATPIPRTLNMSLSGIRDMSVLEEPPQDRHPVQTYVLEHDDGILAQAMEREVRRGGQVYYLFNRIDKIEQKALAISEMLPDARVAVGHGQMSESELSEVWRRLLEHEIDILVCTSIIETGVDVPNANTLIIENADKMGLAQLHQIRGRVGRSAKRAFAYFTFEKGKQLSEEAMRRLTAIREYTEFGSGFQIAMRDLEIRGAGNVLGAQQHGHLAAVGYDMYIQLLNMAVDEEKAIENGETEDCAPKKEEEKNCLLDLQIDAFIPDSYIEALRNRLYMYRRIADIKTKEDSEDVIDELCDRFGEPPRTVLSLIDVSIMRNRAAEIGLTQIVQRGDSFNIYYKDLDMNKIGRLSIVLKGKVSINAGKTTFLTVKIPAGQKPLEALDYILKVLSV